MYIYNIHNKSFKTISKRQKSNTAIIGADRFKESMLLLDLCPVIIVLFYVTRTITNEWKYAKSEKRAHTHTHTQYVTVPRCCSHRN